MTDNHSDKVPETGIMASIRKGIAVLASLILRDYQRSKQISANVKDWRQDLKNMQRDARRN